MPNIYISQQLYRQLLSVATSFNDTEESVIERLIANYKGDSIPIESEEVASKPPRKTVTPEQVAKVYSCINPVFRAYKKGEREGRLALDNACDYLATDAVGMNRGNASIYVRALLALKQGKLHKNKMSFNNHAADYFLSQILRYDNKPGLKTALRALSLYIGYCEKKYSSRMVSFRNIRDKYQAKLDQ
ncbi:MAG: hypothetical protein K8953_06980 [Proteobacteria bacterium]|nr:hypothetical protein [Pseudomonadota bacterium]